MHRGRAVQEALKARPGMFSFDDDEQEEGDLLLRTNPPNSQQRSQDPNDQTLINSSNDEYKRPRIAAPAAPAAPATSSSQPIRSYSQPQPERSLYDLEKEELQFFSQRPYSTLPEPIIEPYSMPSMTMTDMRERTMPSVSMTEVRDLKRQLEDMERKYEQLVDLRYTEAEKLYKDFQEAVSTRLQKSDELVQAFQRSLDERDEEIKELKAELERSKAESSRKDMLDGEDTENEIRLLRSAVQRLQKEKNEALESRKELLVQLARQTGPPDESVHRQIKDMQEDLTGLLITDVKDTKEGTVFNCIQTGRNGTIQFKLIQRSNDSNEMQYRPMLDPHRDAALISALPPYLTFDIDFQKDKANLFYWKLSSALHSKP
ncbi:hypothetical protein VTP01DRAFT_1490 [Rhizomucor pusillus]|uniref:uncharacterized protein n=1 Tax=Rhizomucor pusillus TaxID=4840 RepID=UPI003742B952